MIIAYQGIRLEEGVIVALKALLKTEVPQSVKIFGWRAIQDRLPSKTHLARRGMF